MSKYSGFFLSLLLALFCLWINLWRYPAVWVMVNGVPPTGAVQQSNDEDAAQGKPEPLTVDNSFSPYSSDSSAANDSGRLDAAVPESRGPTPVVVPVSRPKDRPGRSDRDFFRPATLSEPVDDTEIPSTGSSSKTTSDGQSVSIPAVYPAAGSPGTETLSRDEPVYGRAG